MLTDDAVIEPMEVEDLAAVLAIENDCFDDPWREETFRSELRHCWSQCSVLRQLPGREVVGYLVFWRVVDEVHLLNVAVAPSEQHHRRGRALVDHLLDYARDNAARFVTLEVRKSNEAAIGLYESAGFHQAGVRPKYYKDSGEDAIVMVYDFGAPAPTPDDADASAAAGRAPQPAPATEHDA
jgi:ribosomal-protein-alanine N-acetyltransferase